MSKLRVFEAFAGVGSQEMALRNLGIEYDIVGISEIDNKATISKASIHTNYLELLNTYAFPSDEDMVEYLRGINAPLHHKTFEFIGHKIKNKKLKETYLAFLLTNNYGDIANIKTDDLGEIDLFTYSFPCQSISIAGDTEGFEEGSGTKSSLLHECKKIIEAKLPKVLVMENVKNLISKRFKGSFENWIAYLETLGYKTTWKVLNAKEFGVPQNRDRVFAVSTLGGKFEFGEHEMKVTALRDYLESEVDEKHYIAKPFTLVSKPNSNVVAECHLEAFDQNKRIYGIDGTFQCLSAKERGINKILVGDRIRRLTPIECWRLMGFSDEDYYKASVDCSDSQLYKQAGNSIVVNVLEYIFGQLDNQKFFN